MVILVGAIAVVAAVRRSSLPATDGEIPVGQVKRGDMELKVVATGELRATHTITLTAPPVGGGALQITRLSHTGVAVKKGDIVIEFDPSEQRYKLEQNRSELLQAEQEITKAKADAAVLAAQDKVALLKDRFDVRRAELDVQKNELVSAIDGKKNQLALEQAQASAWPSSNRTSSRTPHPARPRFISPRRSGTKRSWQWTRRSRTSTRCTFPRPSMGWSPLRRIVTRVADSFLTA